MFNVEIIKKFVKLCQLFFLVGVYHSDLNIGVMFQIIFNMTFDFAVTA